MHGHRPADPRRTPDDLGELVGGGDLDAAAVEHQRGLRAQRPVHEHLQVADPDGIVSEPGAKAGLLEGADPVVRQRLPDADPERALRLELLPEPGRAEPAVLVVHGGDPSRQRDPHAGAHRLDVLLVGHPQKTLLEPPGGLLAEDAGRLSVLVALDDAARHLEVAVRECEGRRVEPERVVVLGQERRGSRSRDRVEVAARRLDARRPVAAPPAVGADPARRPAVRGALANAGERVLERRAAVEVDLSLGERPASGNGRARR